MIYYLMLIGAAALFSLQFFFQKKFEKEYGTDIQGTVVFSIITGFLMTLVGFVFAGFKIQVTLFALCVAAVHGLSSFGFTYFGLKSMHIANLSVYSVFSMLGGMLLPVFYGMFFIGEKLTIPKLICCILVAVSVLCTINRKGGQKRAWVYYIAVFVANGLTAVCAAVHDHYTGLKVDSYSYMFWATFFLMVAGLICLPFIKGQKRKISKPAFLDLTGFSICSGIGNIILVVALIYLPASLQFPFSTGAAVVFSAIITLIMREKMTKGEIISVFIALAATVCMVF